MRQYEPNTTTLQNSIGRNKQSGMIVEIKPSQDKDFQYLQE